MKTKNYDMFKFREDNRARISQAHVDKLVESIKLHNLLELRPILVNEEMEIIDGQHRLCAAKILAVDIYYEIKPNLGQKEVLIMNNSKNWGINDFLNYYCKNNYPEYLKLNDFIKKHDLQIRVALNMCSTTLRTSYDHYKNGNFIFKFEYFIPELQFCIETIDYISKMNGKVNFTKSSKFWNALVRLATMPDFDPQKWRSNLPKFVERIVMKASTEDYLKLFILIYNWKNSKPLKTIEETLS